MYELMVPSKQGDISIYSKCQDQPVDISVV